MHIHLHDFAGHPFPVQLSRGLVQRGHCVTHSYATGLQGPKGKLVTSADDSERLQLEPIALSTSFKKYSPTRRIVTQWLYVNQIKKLLREQRPDVVLSGNTPIDIQAELLRYCRSQGIGFVHWVQDVYCLALDFFLRRKVGPLAGPLTFPFVQLEKYVARKSDAVVVISPDFLPLFQSWKIEPERMSVVENWTPLDEIVPMAKDNPWSREHGLHDKVVFLYSGTLGLKHRPDLLYKLAQSLDSTQRMVIVSEGVGRKYLDEMPPLPTLLTIDFQAYNRISEVMASADVLVATLERDAGQFAVPSKVLAYHSAGRPLLLAAPQSNLAAKTVKLSGAGLVVDPEDSVGWVEAARSLASDAPKRATLSANARRYAENTFDISRISSDFERILLSACGKTGLISSIQTASPLI